MDRRRYWFKEQLVMSALIGKGLWVNHDITGFVSFTGFYWFSDSVPMVQTISSYYKVIRWFEGGEVEMILLIIIIIIIIIIM